MRPGRSPDPADDYLLAVAESERAVLVTGDQHLLAPANEFPIHSARAFSTNSSRTETPTRRSSVSDPLSAMLQR
jgi:predicted nucleic acid-binding protein